ncbi:MAG: hypothetical protein JOZ15_09400 [Acidobacteria bacterium]|nr:hypothetical protein [Acidobacteriota bacterium]
MRLKRLTIAVTLAGLWALGCGGSNGPTSNNGFTLIMNMGLENSAQQSTIVAAQLLFDGVTTLIGSPSGATGAFVSLQTTIGGVASGSHTVTLQISIQTSSPNSYKAETAAMSAPTIVVLDANNNVLRTITLPIQMATLATGQGITYSFSL